MALLHSFETSGNWLFKHRGIVPVLVFLVCLPLLTFTHPVWNYLSTSGLTKIILTILAVLVSLAGMVVRAYTIGTTPHGTSGRNTEKQVAEQLNTKGIYSIVRHPLYLGNYLMWLGLLIFMMDVPFLVVVSLIYWLYYERIMYAEERFLERKFGESYMEWTMKVPAFIPKFRQFEKGDVPFHFRSVLRREYPGLMAITLCFTLVDYTRIICAYDLFGLRFSGSAWIRPSGIICLVVAVVVITLRTLKHHSKVLAPEENRD